MDGNSYIFRYHDYEGDLNLGLSVCTDSGTTCVQLEAPIELPIREWHHVAVTYDVDGVARFYVDGAALSEAHGGPTSISISHTAFAIGAFVAPPPFPLINPGDKSLQFFDGLLDEIRVWNFVREQPDILRDSTREISGLTTGLVGYWQFDRNNGMDSSALRNDLTNYGARFSRMVPFRK